MVKILALVLLSDLAYGGYMNDFECTNAFSRTSYYPYMPRIYSAFIFLFAK